MPAGLRWGLKRCLRIGTMSRNSMHHLISARLWCEEEAKYRLNHGRFDLPLPLPPNKDREDSAGGSSEGTSGGG